MAEAGLRLERAAPRPLAGEANAQAPVRPVVGEKIRIERGGRLLLSVEEIVVGRPGITAIMGPNGAGKTLLLRCLAGLKVPDSGLVSWAGLPPDRARALRLGFVFQKPVLLRRSALANLVYALKAAGLSGGEARRRAQAALEAARLADLARSPARLLSGGEQQRLALARALSLDPDILFLDEPTASLDPSSTAAIEAMVGKAAARGTACILISHDIGQARRLADEVIFMAEGHIAERAPASRFFDAPASPEARAYLGGEILVRDGSWNSEEGKR